MGKAGKLGLCMKKKDTMARTMARTMAKLLDELCDI